MAESDPQPEQTLPGLVQTALMRMRDHPQVEEAAIQEIDARGAAIKCRIRVNMPTQYCADGQTPTGVQAIESVRFQFSVHFPLYLPHVTGEQPTGSNPVHPSNPLKSQPWTTRQTG